MTLQILYDEKWIVEEYGMVLINFPYSHLLKSRVRPTESRVWPWKREVWVCYVVESQYKKKYKLSLYIMKHSHAGN